jgi:hypothetical protein
MKRLVCALMAGVVVLLLASCGTLPTASSDSGSLSVRVWVEDQLSKELKTLETTWDSLVIQVSGPDMAPVRYASKADNFHQALLDTIEGVPEGKNRMVEAWTITKAGVRIHYGVSMVATVAAGEMVPVVLQMKPVRGSIYINLANVPANVDSIFAAFLFGTDSIIAKDKRAAIMYLSLDNIPDSTFGTLVIRGADAGGVTIYSDSLSFVFYTTQNVTMQAQFMSKPGGLCLEISLQLPGVTVVSGQMGQATVQGEEKGPLVISEIQYYADGDSDYIEIHNPSQTEFSADTMILEVFNTSSTTRCIMTNVYIGPGGFFVIGDSKAPSSWADTVFSMDLTTTGRWIVLKAKDNSIIDWVSYTSKDQEWPTAVKYHAIETDSLYGNPESNNYGRNWHSAETLVEGSTHYGSIKR